MIALVASIARADDTAVAQALFDEGRALANEGHCEEASAKFVASLKVVPTVGAQLNLADCSEKLGRLATAWAHFVDAAALAKRKNDDREAYARKRAAALAPRLARLTLTAHDAPPGLEIRRDGSLIDAAGFGSAIPVDVGTHVVEASAPGYRTFRAEVVIAADGERVSFDVPALEPLPSVATPTATTTSSSEWPTQRTGAIVLAGVGVVGAGVGTFFGLRARSRWNDALSTCTSIGCSADGAAEGRNAQRDGILSTIAFGVAGSAFVGAAILWFTAPHRVVDVAPTAAPGFAGVSIGGAF
jgi:hypothetical protein